MCLKLSRIMKYALPAARGGAADGNADISLDTPRSQYGKSR